MSPKDRIYHTMEMIQSAKRIAQWKGHSLGRWRNGISVCSSCGKIAWIGQAYDEVSVQGEATETSCDDSRR